MTPGSHPEDTSSPIDHGQQTYLQEALRSEHGQTYGGGYCSTSQATASTPAPGVQSPSGYSGSSNRQVYTSTPLIATAQPSVSRFQSSNAASSVSRVRSRAYSGFAPQVNSSFQVNEPCFNCGVYGHWAQFCPEPRRDIPFGSTQAWGTHSLTVPSSQTGTFQQPLGFNLRTNPNTDSPQIESHEARLFREREEKLAGLGVTGCPKPVLPLYRAGYNTSILPSAPHANSSLMRQHEPWPSSQMQHNQAGQSDFQQPHLRNYDDIKDNCPEPQFSGMMSASSHTQQSSPPFTSVPPIIQQGHPSHASQGLNRQHRGSPQYQIDSPNNIGSNDIQSLPHQANPRSIRNAGWRRRNRSGRLSDAVIVASGQNPMVGSMRGTQSAAPSTSATGVETGTGTNQNRKRSHSDQDQDQDQEGDLDGVTTHDHRYGKRRRHENDA